MELELEGCLVVADDRSAIHYPSPTYGLAPGDTYIAKRNVGWQLLTVKTVVPLPNNDLNLLPSDPDKQYGGWVVPKEPAYAYDLWECFKVFSIDNEKLN